MSAQEEAMMRKWLPVVLIGLAFIWFILTNVGSSQALSDIAARPILALVRGDQRIPVQQPGQAAMPDAAQVTGGAGVSFGYRFHFLLPSGDTVTCTIRFSTLSCANGWRAERKA
jgi:hypothetical protein